MWRDILIIQVFYKIQTILIKIKSGRNFHISAEFLFENVKNVPSNLGRGQILAMSNQSIMPEWKLRDSIRPLKEMKGKRHWENLWSLKNGHGQWMSRSIIQSDTGHPILSWDISISRIHRRRRSCRCRIPDTLQIQRSSLPFHWESKGLLGKRRRRIVLCRKSRFSGRERCGIPCRF